jgi:VanZ family protein
LKTFPRAWRYWLPVGAYAALIFYLSSLSHPELYVPSLFMELGDKALHAIEYAVLGMLCYRAFRHGAGAVAASHALLLAIAAASAYGLTDEIHQAFVPLRQADIWDFVTDAIGATLGSCGWYWWTNARTRLKHSGLSASEKRV